MRSARAVVVCAFAVAFAFPVVAGAVAEAREPRTGDTPWGTTDAGTSRSGGSPVHNPAHIYCPICGTKNQAGSRYCLRDGSALPAIDPVLYRSGYTRASETYSSEEIQRAIDLASTSVVRIHARLEEKATYPVARMSSRPGRSIGYLDSMNVGDASAGSGFMISDRGEIVTNAHVAAPLGTRAKLSVETRDGQTFPAKLVGLDIPSDLALLKINTRSIAPLHWADGKRLHLGEETWAVGNPLDIGISVTRGTISSVGRIRMGMNQIESYIHSDAYITHGNSGGPLLNVLGEVVGVSALGFHDEKGQGYSIPSSMARLVIERLRREGAYHRGFLGLHVSPIRPELIKEFSLKRRKGVVVKSILEGSPAAISGFRRGDVLFGIDGRFTPSAYLMQEAVSLAGPGKQLKITLDRSGEVVEISVTTALRPEHPRIDPILHFEETLNGWFEESPKGNGIVFRAPDRFSVARQYGLGDKVRFHTVIPAQDWPEGGLERQPSRGRRSSSRRRPPGTEVQTLDELRQALRRSYIGARVAATFILDLDKPRGVSVAFDETWPIVF